jgi:hypothetical protein
MLQGEYSPAAFTNLWQRQQTGVRLDQQLAACYQSVLEGVSWPDTSGSALLEALRAASEGDKLSIEFNAYGYGRDSTIPRYTMGHIAGTIGPHKHGEPKHFTVGRQMIANAPNFTQPGGGVENFQARVSDDGQSITADFGNTFPIHDANSGLMDIGEVFLAVMTTNPATPLTTVDSTQIQMIGEVPYLATDWYRQTAGVQTFDLTKNSAASQLLAANPLVLLSPAAAADTYKVLIQESIEGYYVRADSFVYRLDPGETRTVDFHASQFGLPLGNTTINFSSTEGFMGGSGGGKRISPPARPNAAIPSIGTPADGVTWPGTIQTDQNGFASLTLTASTSGPGRVRGYIAGQLYGVAYQLAAQPAGYLGNPMNYVSVLAYSRKEIPDHPTWYRDIQHLFTQYGNLYPIMGRYVVDLRNYNSVVTRLSILKLAFSLPRHDANHMPVTRDLGASDRAIILKWLDSEGQDGLPLLGTPADLPAEADVMVPDAHAAASLADLLPSQGAGKTAVLLQLEKRGLTAPTSDGVEK